MPHYGHHPTGLHCCLQKHCQSLVANNTAGKTGGSSGGVFSTGKATLLFTELVRVVHSSAVWGGGLALCSSRPADRMIIDKVVSKNFAQFGKDVSAAAKQLSVIGYTHVSDFASQLSFEQGQLPVQLNV